MLSLHTWGTRGTLQVGTRAGQTLGTLLLPLLTQNVMKIRKSRRETSYFQAINEEKAGIPWHSTSGKQFLGALAPHRKREQHKGLVKQNPAPACGLWAVPSGAHRELLHTGAFQCFPFGNRAGRWFWCPIPGSPSDLLRDSTQC